MKISPHGKVPVLMVDEQPLFESNAIAEYLDEATEPRLHPGEAIKRARNRAWTDFVATFAPGLSGIYYTKTEEAMNEGLEAAPATVVKLETAIADERGNDGPYFNGAAFSMVDAAIRALPATLRPCRTQASKRPAERLPLGPGVVGGAARQRRRQRIGGARIRGRVHRQPEAPRAFRRDLVRDVMRGVADRRQHALAQEPKRFKVDPMHHTPGLIPTGINQNPWAHFRRPIDMIFQG